MSIENLVEYLSTMGRCGAHFSLHSQITSHDFECRRASKALELMQPYVKRGYNYEGYFCEGEEDYADGEVAWHFATYLIESINGGKHYGPDGVYLEVPELVGKMLEKGFAWEARDAGEMFAKSDTADTYKSLLSQCLELRYDWSKNPDLDLGILYASGLENDSPIDYEDF